MSLEPLGIPRELLIFCLHWNREEVGSRTSEGRLQDTAGQMTLPARVEGKGLPCPFMWAVTESLAQIQGGSLYLNDLIKNNPSARWWWRHIPVISALGRPRQEDLCEFEPGLCCETLSWQKRGEGRELFLIACQLLGFQLITNTVRLTTKISHHSRKSTVTVVAPGEVGREGGCLRHIVKTSALLIIVLDSFNFVLINKVILLPDSKCQRYGE